jgi:glycosyltransferase involved in cell wall biosynthesis
MKILLSSYRFAPDVGGIESASLTLAREWLNQGSQVRVITHTLAAGGDDAYPFEILRRPAAGALLAAVQWCDVYFHNNITLPILWPLALVRRPWVVAHQTWLTKADGRVTWRERLKTAVLPLGTSVAISEAVAARLTVPAVVIGNPYREDLFRLLPEVPRTGTLSFLGRLVTDKGCDLLLDALARLAPQGITPPLTVIGDGPERANLEAQAGRLGLTEQVTFLGVRSGEELVRLLNAHQILVVPSRWEEPFGIVALEGIACGCAVVGSAGGGLKDAIGPCGITFANGDAGALAAALEQLLSAPDTLVALRAHAPAHLERHRGSSVARAYLDVFKEAIARCSS